MKLAVQMTLNVIQILVLHVNQVLANVIQFIFGIVHMFWVEDYRMVVVKIGMWGSGYTNEWGYGATYGAIWSSQINRVYCNINGGWYLSLQYGTCIYMGIMIIRVFIRKNVGLDIHYACHPTMMVTKDVLLFQQNLSHVINGKI